MTKFYIGINSPSGVDAEFNSITEAAKYLDMTEEHCRYISIVSNGYWICTIDLYTIPYNTYDGFSMIWDGIKNAISEGELPSGYSLTI